MARRYSSPRHLVAALQGRDDDARAQLRELIRAPLARLMEDLRSRYRLSHGGETLTRNALHVAETYLRTRPESLFSPLDWSSFRAAVLLHVAKLASQPQGKPSPISRMSAELPQSLRYDSRVYFLPYERVGEYWFGGDWIGGRESADGSLWILLADITGHGYHAYLLASALPDVWRRCWETAPASPAELLAKMHDLLSDCLPEGVYAEGTLVCLQPNGEVVAVPAGGSRLLLCRGRWGKPTLLKMRGGWLGLIRPSPNDQQTWTLQEGDELLLATDGLYDQLHEDRPVDVVERLGSAGNGVDLFERVRALLQQALKDTPQQDDITMVGILRRARTANGKNDVPV
jgi:hypothetical protein